MPPSFCIQTTIAALDEVVGGRLTGEQQSRLWDYLGIVLKPHIVTAFNYKQASKEVVLRRGHVLQVTSALGGGRGYPKRRCGKRGCVNSVLWIRPKCRQGGGGGRGQKCQKFCRRHCTWPLTRRDKDARGVPCVSKKGVRHQTSHLTRNLGLETASATFLC